MRCKDILKFGPLSFWGLKYLVLRKMIFSANISTKLRNFKAKLVFTLECSFNESILILSFVPHFAQFIFPRATIIYVVAVCLSEWLPHTR